MASIFNEAEFAAMLQTLPVTVLVVAAVAVLVGVYGERFRAKLARRSWKARRHQHRGIIVPTNVSYDLPITDPSDQLRVVMSATFEKRRIMSKPEVRIFYAAERAVAAAQLNWRVMAQVSLGEVLSSPDARAFSTINSKRVDLLIISSKGEPIAAIEYQGNKHYQGTAPARDAVKKEALRKAGVRYIEITPEHGPDDLVREISRLVKHPWH